MLQLVVYAGMQIPIGVLLDRFGSRAMLLDGLVLMTAGQLVFAFATSFPVAVGARAVLGAGDAMVFVSVIRLVVGLVPGPPGAGGHPADRPGRPARRDRRRRTAVAARCTQLGWTRAFAVASVIGVLLMVAVALLVKDSPYRRTGAGQGQAACPRPQPAPGVGQPRHPAGHVVALHVAVLGDGLHAAVGVPVPGPRPGAVADGRQHLLMVMTGWVVVSGLVLGWLVGAAARSTGPASCSGSCCAMAIAWSVGAAAVDARHRCGCWSCSSA